MKKLNSIIAFTACMALSIPAMAGGESEENALTTAAIMKKEVFDRVQDIKGEYYNLKDATVRVSFFVNSSGDVAVESAKGDNHLASKKVVRLLQENKMYVVPELQNMRHTMTLRYIAP